MSNLSTAIQQADLPKIIDQHFPHARRNTRVKCVWRGGREYSGWLYRSKRDRRWRLRDFVSHHDLDAYGFLTEILEQSKAEASRELLELAGLSADQSHRKPASTKPRAFQPPDLPPGVAVTLRDHLKFTPKLLEDLMGWLELALPSASELIIPENLSGWLRVHQQLGIRLTLDSSPIGIEIKDSIAEFIALNALNLARRHQHAQHVAD